MSTVADQVRRIIAEQFGVAAADVKDDAKLADDLGADSLDLIELAMALEDEFGIDLPDAEIIAIRSVRQAVDYVDAKVPKPCARCSEGLPVGCGGMFRDEGPVCLLNSLEPKP